MGAAQDVLEGTLVVNTPEAWDCKAINIRYLSSYWLFFFFFGFKPAYARCICCAANYILHSSQVVRPQKRTRLIEKYEVAFFIPIVAIELCLMFSMRLVDAVVPKEVKVRWCVSLYTAPSFF